MEAIVPLFVAVPLGVAFAVVILSHVRALHRLTRPLTILAVLANLLLAVVLLGREIGPIYVGGWGATGADGTQTTLGIELVCDGLAKLMLIKDEFYVARLLTSFEKLRRDRQRYNVNPANGDAIRYKRVFHPRFFGRQIDLPLPHWSLYVVRQFWWTRRLMPWLRRDERRLLRWYEGVVDGFAYDTDADYARQLELFRCVEPIRGYAEYRRPKTEAARSRGEQLRRARSAESVMRVPAD